MESEAMVSRQRAFWNTGATRSVEWRLNQLKKLEQALEERAQLETCVGQVRLCRGRHPEGGLR